MAICFVLSGISFAGDKDPVSRKDKVNILIEHYQVQANRLKAEYQVIIKNLQALVQERQAIIRKEAQDQAVKDAKQKASPNEIYDPRDKK